MPAFFMRHVAGKSVLCIKVQFRDLRVKLSNMKAVLQKKDEANADQRRCTSRTDCAETTILCEL